VGVDQKIFIAVAGNIGTGKTTLTQMLSKRFGWEAHFEVVADNPYLADFYRDLNNRFKAHETVTQRPNSAIQDRTIYEDAAIFARNLYEQGQMEERDYLNYLDLYKVMASFLNPPDLIIYLRKSLPRLKQRIAQRGRDYEQSIPDAYLTNLNRYYDEWMATYDAGKKLIIESDDLDFVKKPEDFDMICHQIVEHLPQRDLFLESLAATGADLRQGGLMLDAVRTVAGGSRPA
jgi:deoxyadenosine/deoxycytidine kinase